MCKTFDGQMTPEHELAEALRASEERFRAVTESAVDAIITIDSGGKIVYWNNSARRTFGYAFDEVGGRSLNCVIPGRFRPFHEAALAKTAGMSSRSVRRTVEVAGLRKDGTEFPIELSLATWKAKDETFFTGIIRDITRRKRAEQAVYTERERLAVTLRSIGDGVIVTDTAGNVTMVNKLAEELTGRTQAEAQGRPLAEVLNIRQTALTAMDGIEKSIDHRCSPIRDADGGLIGSVLAFRDVSNEREIEDKLKEQEERYRTLFERLPTGVLIIDPETALPLDFNDAACGRLGYSRAEFARLRVSDYEAMEKPEEIFGRIKKVRKEGSDCFETKHRTKTGELRNVFVVIQLVQLAGRDVLQCIFQDITDRTTAKTFSDALNEINASLVATLDPDEIMKRAVVSGARALGAESAAIIIRENERWAVKHAHGTLEELSGRPFASDEFIATARSNATGETLVIDDARNDDRLRREVVAMAGIRSALIVPLAVRRLVKGSLLFSYHSEAVGFNERQVDFAKKLAASLSLVLENARLYQQEHKIAVALQETLLGMPDKVPGVDFGHLYRSATFDPARVGGDFYKVFEIAEGKIGIFIGDVSGKGLAAAQQTAKIENTLQAYAHDGYGPAEVLTRANALIVKTGREDAFVTLFFGILDTGSGCLTYSTAGHPPAIVRRAGGEIALLPSAPPAFGIFPDARFTEFEASIGPGDAFFLYTDGVTEARNPCGFFAEEGLCACIENAGAAGAGELPGLVFEVIANFTAGKFKDDIAMLCLELA